MTDLRQYLSYRVKLGLFAVGILIVLFVFHTAYQGLNTLQQLDVIEAERDQWQRPTEVIQALNLKPGDTVVDLGCGSGYFALKLSSEVGPSGIVYAVDIRRLSLTFLWIRAINKDKDSVKTVHATPEDTRVPPDSANAVLIANTYHELAHRKATLTQVHRSLRSGGRLVVVEPAQTEHGELSSAAVESELRESGFEVIRRDDSFIDHSARGLWWLIVARRL